MSRKMVTHRQKYELLTKPVPCTGLGKNVLMMSFRRTILVVLVGTDIPDP